MEERSFHFPSERKKELEKLLFEEKQLPRFPAEVDHISYLDGVKICFRDGGWIIARFSGTEPLLRIFCEMDVPEKAAGFCEQFVQFLGLTGDRRQG